MTPEAQQRAIQMETGLMTEGWSPTYADPDNSGGHPEAEPYDFLNDLNACHEMEKTLTPNLFWAYYERIIGDFDLYEGEANPMIIHATASHRAECFLKTLNLWEESK